MNRNMKIIIKNPMKYKIFKEIFIIKQILLVKKTN